MSKRGDLSREQAAAMVGEAAVSRVESANCEPTGRVGYNGACQGDALTEWCAALHCKSSEGVDCTLLAYYYTTHKDDAAMAAADGDGTAIDWQIAGFEVV